MSVFALGAEEIDRYWSSFEDHLYRFERLGEISVTELRDDLKEKKKQLWGYQDGSTVLGIAITRVAGKTCEICGAVGTQRQAGQILELYAEIEAWAKSIGCERMRIVGRKGWLRVLVGYCVTGVRMEKEI